MIATIAVVFQHAAQSSFYYPDRISPLEWGLATTVVGLTKWAVPVFVMLSGALLLEPRSSDTLSAFYRRRFARLGLPLLFWSLFYLALKAVFMRGGDWASVLPKMLLEGRPFYHMFFLFVIVGLYAFTPMFRRFLASATSNEQLLAIALSLGIAALATLLGDGPNTAFTLFLPYVGYFIAGSWIRQHLAEWANGIWPWVVFVAATAVLIGGTLALAEPNGGATEYLHHYQSVPLIAMSLGIFTIALVPGRLGERDAGFARLCTRLSPLLLGVYLIHPFVIKILAVTTGITGAKGPVVLSLPFVAVVAFTVSLGLTALLRRGRLGAALVGG